MAVLAKMTALACDKAKTSGIAVVAASGYGSATGALGHWARQLAEAGLVGIVLSQCPEMVAPHGSFEPIFGTNPIAISCPNPNCAATGGAPVVLDMATSTEAYYHLVTQEAAGQSIAPDVAWDAVGQPTTDPAAALAGALRVFDRGHKGSGLALMVELLAGAVTGAAMEDKKKAGNWGSLVLALDPGLFGDRQGTFERVAAMCARVRGARRLDGVDDIFLPGERGDLAAARARDTGVVALLESVVVRLKEMATAQSK
jgi:LDH2 family malate/lactate/ureidoglycolate dehydrogenase